ncbi:MAG: CHAT domain-containing tetratricopeptide repeat protein [bacterium]
MDISNDKLRQIARGYLAGSGPDGVDPSVLAEACNQLIRLTAQESTSEAMKLSRRFVRQSRPCGGNLLTTAYRAQAWVLLVGGHYQQAEETYIKARQRLRRDPIMRSRIDRILIDVNMYLGRMSEARRRASLAMRTFRRLGAADDLAKTQVNFANLLHRQDRHRQASRLYQGAADHFRQTGQEVAVALCYYNLANSLVQLFDFERARELYQEALDSFAKHGYTLYTIDCRNGMAWLHMLQGDYHMALRELKQCEDGYRQVSQPRGVVLCRLDRAEAFLGLNLFVDALESARQALRGARRLGINYEAAKASFFAAKAAVGMGKLGVARRALKPALEGFHHDRSSGFYGAARLLSAQLTQQGEPRRRALAAARQHFGKAQLPLWQGICDLHLLEEEPDDEAILRRLGRNPAVKAVPHLMARQQTAIGDRAARQGRQQQAIACWTKAADVLDIVRAKLPPVEMRSAFAKNRTEPHLRLVRVQADERPKAAAAWVERYQTAGLWATAQSSFENDPARRRAQESLARLASQVTALSAHVDSDGRRMGVTALGSKQLVALQRSVRQDLAYLERTEGKLDRLELIIDSLERASAKQPVVQLHIDNQDLVAFVHHRKITKFHRFIDGADELSHLLSRWRFMVSRQMYGRNDGNRHHLADEQQLLKQLGDWLWAPLEVGSDVKRILVIPQGRAFNLPWSAICHDGRSLAERHHLVLAPSLRHHLHARRIRVRSDDIDIFVGRTAGLPHYRKELAALARHATDQMRWHQPACRADVPDHRAARIWHYAGHATLRSDNPFYSALELEDGPFFAADLRLRSNRVGLVMLAGCRTGQQIALPGEESTGLVRSFLEMGARNVIGSHWAIADDSASLWTRKFYQYLFEGLSVTTAVTQASIEVRRKFRSAYHWAAFSVFGAG